LGVAHQIAAGMGWSLPYTLSVLRRWKMAAAYCQAVLSHAQRIALDGAPAETVDAGARDLAAAQLARLAARKAGKKAAVPAKPKPKPAPPTDRVRARPLGRRQMAPHPPAHPQSAGVVLFPSVPLRASLRPRQNEARPLKTGIHNMPKSGRRKGRPVE
jgi:sRNA-binding protein